MRLHRLALAAVVTVGALTPPRSSAAHPAPDAPLQLVPADAPLSNPAPAGAQLKRLDDLLTKATADTPLKGRVKRTKVAGADGLVLTLDSSLVPLDQIPWGQIEQEEGQFQKLRDRLKKMTLAVGLL